MKTNKHNNTQFDTQLSDTLDNVDNLNTNFESNTTFHSTHYNSNQLTDTEFDDTNHTIISKFRLIPWWIWLCLGLLTLIGLLLWFLFKNPSTSHNKTNGIVNMPNPVKGVITPSVIMPPLPKEISKDIKLLPTTQNEIQKTDTANVSAETLVQSPPKNNDSNDKLPVINTVPNQTFNKTDPINNSVGNLANPSTSINTTNNNSHIENSIKNTLCDSITLAKDIQFLTASAVLTPASIESLNTMAKSLKQCSIMNIEIAGHTDSSGHAERHLGLSQRRANSVMKALIKAGVSNKRLIAKGYGSTKPIADNATEEGQFKNRRVEFIIR